MPQQVITFGSPDTERLDGLTNTEHFQGAVTGSAPEGELNYDDLVAANGTLNAADALSTDDTATYGHADNDGLEAAMWSRYPSMTGRNLYLASIRGLQDASFTLPAGATSVRVTLIGVARASVAVPVGAARLQLATYPVGGGNPANFDVDVSIDVANTWQRYEVDVVGFDSQAFIDRRNVMQFLAVSSKALAAASWYDVAYLGLRVTWTDPTDPTTPPKHRPAYSRILQRGNDGLGASGGPRIIQARTVQATNRRGSAIR